MAPHCHHTQPKIHEIRSDCGGCVNNLVLLAACESSNWLLQKLQFSFGVLEMDMECLGSLFSFPLKILLEIFFSCFLNSRTYVQELTAGRWLSGHGAWYARARSIRTWICTLGVLWKLRYGYVQPEPQCFGGGVVTGASERLASQLISENTSSMTDPVSKSNLENYWWGRLPMQISGLHTGTHGCIPLQTHVYTQNITHRYGGGIY